MSEFTRSGLALVGTRRIKGSRVAFQRISKAIEDIAKHAYALGEILEKFAELLRPQEEDEDKNVNTY